MQKTNSLSLNKEYDIKLSGSDVDEPKYNISDIIQEFGDGSKLWGDDLSSIR